MIRKSIDFEEKDYWRIDYCFDNKPVFDTDLGLEEKGFDDFDELVFVDRTALGLDFDLIGYDVIVGKNYWEKIVIHCYSHFHSYNYYDCC